MPTTTISAGGIAPLADGVPAHTDRLIALSFTINDRPLVRLIPEKLNQAETLTLGSLLGHPGQLGRPRAVLWASPHGPSSMTQTTPTMR